MAIVHLTKQAPAVSRGEIEAFEKRQGISLPDAYKTFLLTTNGGEPTPDRLIISGWRGKSTCVSRFFGLSEGGHYDLEKSLSGVEDYVPTGFVPIAEDSGGNLLCLGIKDTHAGKVFFWDHEQPQGDDPRNLREVANSIDELLDKLIPM